MRFSLLIIFMTLCSTAMSTACTADAPGSDERPAQSVDAGRLLEDLRYLSSDELEGRKTGSDGAELAARYVAQVFEEAGLTPFGEGYRHGFRHRNERTGEFFSEAVNVLGYMEGSRQPDRFIVVTAHYDHLGRVGDQIFNGADDNASGTAAILELARHFSEHPPENSLLFIAFDAEEQGLGGSRAFVENPPLPLDRQVIVVNLDMISRNDRNEIYVAGTYHYPFLAPLVEEATVEAPVLVRFGYDSPEAPDDWTMSSDHGPFHQSGIPFLYFGVEDHEHYHHPDDTFEHVNQDFYVGAVETVLEVITRLDRNLERVAEESGRFRTDN